MFSTRCLLLARLNICSGEAFVIVHCRVTVSVVLSHFLTISLKPLPRFKPNFMRSINGQGEQIIVQRFQLELFSMLWGQFYLHDNIFLQTTSPKPHEGFQGNSTENFLWWNSIKIVQMYDPIHKCPRYRGLSVVIGETQNLNIIVSLYFHHTNFSPTTDRYLILGQDHEIGFKCKKNKAQCYGVLWGIVYHIGRACVSHSVAHILC